MPDSSAIQREAIEDVLDEWWETLPIAGRVGGLRDLADAVFVLVEAWLADAVQAERERAIRVVRDFPLNICGDGSPMPRDYAATVEQFREAALAAVSRDTRSSSDE